MSPDRELIERLPWYLNATLDDGEAAEIEELLAESTEARRELAEVQAAARIYGHRLPTEVIVAYAFDGGHPEVPTELIERHLAVSPLAARELELVRESRTNLVSDARSKAGAAEVTTMPTIVSGAAPWRRLALAASIVGVAALSLAGWEWMRAREGETVLARTEQQLREALAREPRVAAGPQQGWRLEELEEANDRLAAGKSDLVEQIQERDRRIEHLAAQVADLSQPLANIPVIDVWPGDMVLRGADEVDRVVVIPRGTRSVALILNSSIQDAETVGGMQILGADGEEVWRSPITPERDELGTFTVAIPVRELGVGRYALQLIDQQDGQTRVVETYQIEIR